MKLVPKIENWSWEWWINIPALVLVPTNISIALASGGHAPRGFAVSFFIVFGPAGLLLDLLRTDDMYFRERWRTLIGLSSFFAPSLLALLYYGSAQNLPGFGPVRASPGAVATPCSLWRPDSGL